MSSCQGRPGTTRFPRRLRSVFISDTHLGSRYAQAEPLLAFLQQIKPDYLYLVGDIIDGWRLAHRWHWQPAFSRVLGRLLELGQSGTRVRYTPGNHDGFLRDFLHDFGFVEIADEFIHYTADERRLLVLHGDRFDDVELRTPWISMLGARAYDSLLALDYLLHRWRRTARAEPCRLSGTIKRRVKRAVRFVSQFEARLAEHGREMHCDAVVCGHVHTPQVADYGGLAYFNTGDWVEHRTALVEWNDGALELLHLPAGADEWSPVALPPVQSVGWAMPATNTVEPQLPAMSSA
jgi:UDP-2,3-diacylglucosamine pyrophosphatase LpxH